MNRIIKFRGLAVSSGEMVYGCLIKKRYNALADWMIQDLNGLGSDVVTKSIGQFTGLFDVDGGMIWEGDILSNKKRDTEDNFYVCEYIEIEAKFIFCSPLDGECLEENDIACDLKVIGNIHHNKELLNAQN